ncbi:MAG: hypothetical protein Q9M22_07670 [Mariprofundaceae bacterium]|nr:hypothetical protein [Mariprofundaceae bacterium]
MLTELKNPRFAVPDDVLSALKVADNQVVNIVGEAIAGNYTMPRGLARCALFGMCAKGSRKQHDKKEMAAWKGWKITHTGEQLDQGDLDVWLAVCRMIASTDGRLVVSFRTLLGEMGANNVGGTRVKRLRVSLQRLHDGILSIQHNEQRFDGPLLRCDQDGGKMVITLPRSQSWLWRDVVWLDCTVRQSIKPNLSKWLHHYTSSHRGTQQNPSLSRLIDLHRLCASQQPHIRRFRFNVRAGFDTLHTHQCIQQWYISPQSVVKFSNQ